MQDLIKPVYSVFQLTFAVASAVMVTAWAIKVGPISGVAYWLGFSLLKRGAVKWLTRTTANPPSEAIALRRVAWTLGLIHATQAATLLATVCR